MQSTVINQDIAQTIENSIKHITITGIFICQNQQHKSLFLLIEVVAAVSATYQFVAKQLNQAHVYDFLNTSDT